VAKRIYVKPGERFDDKVEIFTDEIKGGEQLIYAGQASLMDGQPVEVVTN
jgi:hypothetical protein